MGFTIPGDVTTAPPAPRTALACGTLVDAVKTRRVATADSNLMLVPAAWNKEVRCPSRLVVSGTLLISFLDDGSIDSSLSM